MTYLTFKSYVRHKFFEYKKAYYPEQYMYINNALKLAEENKRFAIIAQAYFTTNKNLEYGNRFSKMTGEKFITIDEFIKHKGKYQEQFRKKNERKISAKKHIINIINKKMKEKKISISSIAKKTNIDRSNLHKVLSKGLYKNTSLRKLLWVNESLNTI